MTLSRRLAKPGLVLVALALLAVALSACAVFKEGSFRMSQPKGIGPVAVHFAICTEPTETGVCEPNESEGQAQYMLSFAVRPGTTPPATITAAPVHGGAPIFFNRNDEVSRSITRTAAENESTYPPAGTEAVGYLSAVFTGETGATREWSVDTEFGLPVAADGGSFGGPFTMDVIYGWRLVDDMHPADRPVNCFEFVGEPPTDATAICDSAAEGEIGTSDLKIGAPAQVAAFVGGKVKIAFPFDFASTASPLPSFGLAATSTMPKATLALSTPTFVPGAPDPSTHRSPAASRTVKFTVPSNAKPGVYDVTLTATAPQGGAVSQVAKLKVTKPKLKLGGVKLNKAKGTANLSIGVSSAGTLTVAGKGLVKVKKKTKKAKTLKITIKAKGQSKAQLEELGKAKVKAKLSFKPTSGIVAKKTKAITLFLRP